MRKILLFMLLSAFVGALDAQSLKVVVQMNGEPLYMAYVLVGGRHVALTDSLGSATLDASTLREGDRIGAAYVGTSPTEVPYSREIARLGVCTIEMTPDFVLSEVVVRSEMTGWDIFSKYTRIPLLFERRHDSKMTFSFTHTLPDEPQHTIRGTILMNRETSRMSAWDYDRYARNLLIHTRDDTTGLTRQLLTNLYFTLQVANGAIYRVGVDAFRDPDSPQYGAEDGRILFSFKHLGVEGDDRLFEVTNDAYTMRSSRPLRYLFRVDNSTRRIRSSESIHILPFSRYNQRTKSTYELYRLRWLKPETAELESVHPLTGETFRLALRDITYNSLSRRERKALYGDAKSGKDPEKLEKREAKRAERQKNRLWWGIRPE
jgi:hypothetical protein